MLKYSKHHIAPRAPGIVLPGGDGVNVKSTRVLPGTNQNGSLLGCGIKAAVLTPMPNLNIILPGEVSDSWEMG